MYRPLLEVDTSSKNLALTLKEKLICCNELLLFAPIVIIFLPCGLYYDKKFR